MIVKPEVMSQLKHLGINSYEAKIWVALLSRGVATAGELSDISNVPRSRTYDVLESLEKKGFIIIKLGKPIKYIAVKPEEVLERVKKKTREDLDVQLKIVDSLKQSDALSELGNLYTQGISHIDPTELSTAMRGRSNIYAHVSSLVKGAKKSVKLASTNDAAQADFGLVKSALKKTGKKAKFYVQGPDKKLLSEMKKLGQHVNKDVGSRIIVIDDAEVVFFLTDGKINESMDTAVHVKSPMFAKALAQMVDVI